MAVDWQFVNMHQEEIERQLNQQEKEKANFLVEHQHGWGFKKFIMYSTITLTLLK